MEETKRYSPRMFSLEVLGILLAIVFLVPFYFVLTNSFKPFSDILVNTTSLPKSLSFHNYEQVWKIMDFPKVFLNSLIITVASNVGLVVISAMAAYRMVRNNNRVNQILFLLFVSAMIIPFESIMIPLVKLAGTIGFLNEIWGVVICYFGFGVSLNLFLYHGFVKSIPLEIEEAAIVDGCSPFGLFWRIIFPLLKPITVTIVLLNSLWIWNDFLLPLLIISGPETRTIPLATYSFFGQYTKQWDMALAALTLGVLPIIAFFLGMQKHIIEGITAGSVKG
ncbi:MULTISPECIES: carbohydrate ABC transporter permease [Cohnella]|uniref:Carbohydrate ABC transporter membrane protein 2 (CUT1 family) n=1 Tax=Cohnella phaseoli TaxID=456490 RepID=A0A3D9IML0_9BACL|nr:carbohydrate ABC transporter permease [Cohnella phaseoli]RED62927.1 carbohydrate ABC transporter membrane protein 2 (CUT1 family) [Cohnella phaseoli]